MAQLGILLATLIVQIATATDRHKIVYKSLQEATNECNLYSVQDECLTRCVTLITRDWNDVDGMSPVYNRFFRPDPDDGCSNNRTQRCLQTNVMGMPPRSTCHRASQSVQCYLDQYGELNAVGPQFVRFSILQDAQLVLDCGAMLGFSEDELNALLMDDEFRRPETRCLLRCFMIRSGLYSDSTGLNMARYYVLCGGYEDSFYDQVAECQARLRQEVPCDDRCTLAQRMAVECIGVDYETSQVIQSKGNQINVVTANQGSEVNLLDAQLANSVSNLSYMQKDKSISINNQNSDINNSGNTLRTAP